MVKVASRPAATTGAAIASDKASDAAARRAAQHDVFAPPRSLLPVTEILPSHPTSVFDPGHDGGLHRARLLRIFPRRLRERHGALGGFDRLRIRRGAVANAAGDTLGDARKAEQI